MDSQAHKNIPSQLQGIIFDCDGVILHSRAANEHYYNLMLKALGLPPLTKEQESFTYMATVHQALDYIVPEHLQHKIKDIQHKVIDYKRDIMPHVELEEGFLDFIDWAKSRHLRLAVHTNRSNGMPFIIEKFNLYHVFDPIITAADVQPKPKPDGIFKILELWNLPKEAVIFIGDSPNDQDAAKAAKVSFVSYDNEELDAAIKVGHFKALQDMLEKSAFER